MSFETSLSCLSEHHSQYSWAIQHIKSSAPVFVISLTIAIALGALAYVWPFVGVKIFVGGLFALPILNALVFATISVQEFRVKRNLERTFPKRGLQAGIETFVSAIQALNDSSDCIEIQDRVTAANAPLLIPSFELNMNVEKDEGRLKYMLQALRPLLQLKRKR